MRDCRDLDTVQRWVQPSGWRPAAGEGAPQDGLCLANGEERVFFGSSETWLSLAVPILFSSPLERLAAYPNLHRHLLNFSHEGFLWKYCLTPPNEIVMRLELPWLGLCAEELLFALEGLTVCRQARELFLSEIIGDLSDATVSLSRAKPAPALDSETEWFPVDQLKQFSKAAHHLRWTLKEQIRPNHWHGQYQGPERPFDTYISFDRFWAYFQMPLLYHTEGGNHISDHSANYLGRFLLRANDSLFWVRLGMDDENQVLLLLDVPLADLSYARFERAIRTLAAAADRHFFEIQVLANLDRDPKLANLLASSQELRNA